MNKIPCTYYGVDVFIFATGNPLTTTITKLKHYIYILCLLINLLRILISVRNYLEVLIVITNEITKIYDIQ